MPACIADPVITENEEFDWERMERGACHFPGCACTGFVPSGDDRSVCERPECGHGELDHSVV
jgi:hypothetical protein